MTVTTLRALVVQSMQAQVLLACGHEDPQWRASRHCGLCPAFGVGFAFAVHKERVAGRRLPAPSFDALVELCGVLLDEANSRRDFSVAAALLQARVWGCRWWAPRTHACVHGGLVAVCDVRRAFLCA
jgi:hypothetical protein